MKRRIYSGMALAHVYQRPSDKGVVFYSEIDYIQFFTLICMTASKYNIRIVSICIMPDHFHLLIEAENMKDISLFMQYCNARSAVEFNDATGRKGRFWTKAYGMSLKYGNKKKRTAIAYVNNNGIEKNLSDTTEKYRWNFLCYRNCDPLAMNQCSKNLRKAVSVVNTSHKLGFSIARAFLLKQQRVLSKDEWGKLCDHIIKTYNIIDYEYEESFYGDFGTMIIALNSNTGSEYDIKEDSNPYSDIGYSAISEWLKTSDLIQETMRKKLSEDSREILNAGIEERENFASCLIDSKIAPEYLVRKYLHLPCNTKR